MDPLERENLLDAYGIPSSNTRESRRKFRKLKRRAAREELRNPAEIRDETGYDVFLGRWFAAHKRSLMTPGVRVRWVEETVPFAYIGEVIEPVRKVVRTCRFAGNSPHVSAHPVRSMRVRILGYNAFHCHPPDPEMFAHIRRIGAERVVPAKKLNILSGGPYEIQPETAHSLGSRLLAKAEETYARHEFIFPTEDPYLRRIELSREMDIAQWKSFLQNLAPKLDKLVQEPLP